MKTLVAFVFALFLSGLTAQEKPSAEVALSQLQLGNFDAAIEGLSGDLAALAAAADGVEEDELRLHQARAFYLAGMAGRAVELCDLALRDFPESKWRGKIVFLKAEALASLRKFEAALAIYQKEATRIFEVSRKDELAGRLVDFAEFFATEPKPGDLDAPKADYGKALTLYGQALDIDCADELKEKMRSRMVRLYGLAGQWGKAEVMARQYLRDFDPSWRGGLDSVERMTTEKNEQLKFEGGNRFLVKYRLGEALHRLKRLEEAVRYLEELDMLLVVEADLKALRADAYWLRLMAMMKEGMVRDLDEWVGVSRKYLEAYPDHIWAERVAFKIGRVYAEARQWEKARAAYGDFFKGQGFVVPKEKPLTIDEKGAADFEARKRRYEERRELASFEIGRIYLTEKKFEEADAQWSKTAKVFPNGRKWAECQKGLVEIDYLQVLESVREIGRGGDGKGEAARSALEGFLVKHPLDGRLPQLLFVLGEISYQEAVLGEEEKWKLTPKRRKGLERAIVNWRRLISKYPQSRQAQEAEYKIGQVYEFRLGDLEKAVEIYGGVERGRARKAVLVKENLQVATERVFGTSEKPEVMLSLRNVESVKIRQYWIDFESYYRKGQDLAGIEELDVDLVEADKVWEVEIPEYQRYLPMEHRVAIPFGNRKAGVCVIKVESEKQESTTVVVRSDLELVVRSGREETVIFAKDWKTGKGAVGVKVVLAEGAKVIASGVTGEDGVWHCRDEKLSKVRQLRVLGISDRGMAGQALSIGGLAVPVRLKPTGVMTASRMVHRPGELVNLKVVVRAVKEDKQVVPMPDERVFELEMKDPAGRLLSREKVELDEFGAVQVSLSLPDRLPTGPVGLVLSGRLAGEKVTFSQSLQVTREGLRKVVLAMEMKKNYVKPGEVVQGKVTAKYRWGAPLAKRKLILTMPGGLRRDLSTDEKGEAVFEYPTEGKGQEEFVFSLSAPSTDGRPVTELVWVVDRDFVVTASMDEETVLSERPFFVNVVAKSLMGVGEKRKVRVEVLRIERVGVDLILAAVPGLSSGDRRSSKEERVVEQMVETDATSGEGKVRFQLAKGGSYRYRVFVGEREVFSDRFVVSDQEDATKLRIYAVEKSLTTGQKGAFELHSRLEKTVPALVTIETGKVLEHRVIEMKPGFNDIEVETAVAHSPGFAIHVMALDDRRLYEANRWMPVRRELKVEMTIAGLDGGVARPKEKAVVTLKVKDGDGKSVEALTAVAVVRRDDVPWIRMAGDQFWMLCQSHQFFLSGSTVGFEYLGEPQTMNQAIQGEQQRQEMTQTGSLNRQQILPNAALGLNAFDRPLPEENQDGILPGQSGAFIFSGGGVIGNAVSVDGRLIEISEDYRNQSVRTNAEGVAVIEMVMPEDADEWMVMGQALTKGGTVGGEMEELVVRDEMTVALEVPWESMEGDVFVPKVLVSREVADKRAKGVLVLSRKVEGGEAVEIEKEVVFKKGQKTVEVFFEKLTAVEDLEFQAKVSLGDVVREVEGSVLVSAWGAPVVAHGGMLAKPGKRSFELNLREDAAFETVRLASLIDVGDVLDQWSRARGFGLLEGDAPGFGKSSGGRLLRNLEAIRIRFRDDSESAGVLYSIITSEDIADLVLTQDGGGGWAAHVGRSVSDAAETALAYEALVRAKELGLTVDAGVLKRAGDYLQKAVGVSNNNLRAVIQQALSVNGKGDFSACNRLFRVKGELSPFGQGHLAMAFVNLERPEFARKILEDLVADEVGAMGRALQAWAAVGVNDAKAISLEEKFWRKVRLEGSGTANAGALAAVGIGALYEAREAVKSDFEAVIRVNGKEVATISSAKPESYRGGIKVEARFLKKGRNEVTVEMKGQGFLWIGTSVAGVLKEYPKEDWDGQLQVTSREFVHPGQSYRGLPLASRGRSLISKVAVGERVRVRLQVKHTRRIGGEIVIWERIPAGFEYLAGSLRGSHSGARMDGEHLVITHVGAMRHEKVFTYEIVAKRRGTWRVAPTMMFPVEAVERASFGTEGKLVVLAEGRKGNEEYRYELAERFELARMMFRDGDYEGAAEQLAVVRKANANYQAAEAARMTLWIETGKENPDARLVADSFEVLNELSPDLEIPFGKILQVGEAYRALGEFERGMDVFLATIEAGFARESFVGAALDDQGRFLDSLDFQSEHWLEFPDYGEVANAWFALGQEVYGKAATAKDLQARKGEKKGPTERELYLKSVEMLEAFRLHYPKHPMADDGAFTIANALFTLKSYDKMVAHSKASQAAYPESDFGEAFQYLEALGSFWLRNYEVAFTGAKKVAEGSGKDRNLSAYICAQVRHAQGRADEALNWYEKVKGEYPDALDAIAWFEQKKIELDEVKTIPSGETVEITLKHRNIENADLQIYRVDLMKLYLREKNLSDISKVNLAGISPKYELKIRLKKQDGFSDQESKIKLPMEKDGAYLVICRGDYLYTSGLVLVTPLKMETQEIPRDASVRVNVMNRKGDAFLDGVHVKAIGSDDEKFQSGETDLRGIWSTKGIRGAATVIARDQKGNFAFYRGEKAMKLAPRAQQQSNQYYELNYNGSNDLRQDELLKGNKDRFEKLRRSKGKGVKVNKAIKK